MPTPRLFIIRHGETEWSLSGRHTGTTDIPLTPAGEQRIRATSSALIGSDRLIQPKNLARIYVSPRRRAQRTLELLNIQPPSSLPWSPHGNNPQTPPHTCTAPIRVTEDVREWDYGVYEGIKSSEISALRQKEGKEKWDIWRDGCPGGESPSDITERLDRIIHEIREEIHSKSLNGNQGEGACDVLIVAHGHILRALAGRWIGRDIGDNPSLILEAGGVGTLSYEHGRVEEPAILLGGAFVSDLGEKVDGK